MDLLETIEIERECGRLPLLFARYADNGDHASLAQLLEVARREHLEEIEHQLFVGILGGDAHFNSFRPNHGLRRSAAGSAASRRPGAAPRGRSGS